jgi:hypothetical protein
VKQEDHEFKANLGYIVRPHFKKIKTTKNKHPLQPLKKLLMYTWT